MAEASVDATQHTFVAEHYTPRAKDYVNSVNHSTGDDLDQIEAMLQGASSSRVLDLGCGGGHVSYRAAPHVAHVVACDVTASMLEVVAQTAAERDLPNITVRQGAAEHLPFSDAAYDDDSLSFHTEVCTGQQGRKNSHNGVSAACSSQWSSMTERLRRTDTRATHPGQEIHLHSKAEYICADLLLDQTSHCSRTADHTL